MSDQLPDALAGLLGLLERVRRQDVRAEHLGRVPPAQGGRASAVLLLFAVTGSGVDVLLLERASTLRSHAGQVAFPGGARDPPDADIVATALREAVEETGLDPQGVQILGTLPELYIAPSGFLVTPVLGWWRSPSPVRCADPREVASVHRVPLAALTDPGNRRRVRHSSGFVGPAFRVAAFADRAGGTGEELLVWGFTALLLERVLHYAGWLGELAS